MDTVDSGSPAAFVAKAVALMVLGVALACESKAPVRKAAAAAACDPARDRQGCLSDTAMGTCDEASKTWLTTGYCSNGAHCVAQALPEGITPVGAEFVRCEGGTAVSDASSDGIGVAVGGPTAVRIASDATATGTDAKAGADSDSSGGDAPAEAGPSALCGNGVCDSSETAASCAKDCATPVCGDAFCAAAESKANCAWDCVAGAAAGAQCMIANCPSQGAVCSPAPGCLLKLAQVWACAKGCSGCLPQCLQAASTDPVAFQVVACGAAQCVGAAP